MLEKFQPNIHLTGHWSGTQPDWYWRESQWWWPVCQWSLPQGWQSWSEHPTSGESRWSLHPGGQWCNRWAGGGKQITRTRDDIYDLHLLLHDLHRLEWSARESQSAQRRPSQLRGTREATVNVWTMAELNHICIICPPTLEALVAMCNWEGALLHGQLVKFGELLKCGRKGHKDNYDEGGKKIQLEFCKYFPCKIDERKKMRWGMKK